MLTYIINVNNCINMDYYDFFFYESESYRKIVLINIDSFENADKQMDELILELEEHYFESIDNYQIIVCVPRYIVSSEDFTDNSDFVLSYRIRKCIGSRFRDYDKIRVFSFVHCNAENKEIFSKTNTVISNQFYSDERSMDFPQFSKISETVTEQESESFFNRISQIIKSCNNKFIRKIYSEIWQKFGISNVSNTITTSEWESFYALHDELEKVSLKNSCFINHYIYDDDIAGDKNLEIFATLKLIDFLLKSDSFIEQKEFDGHNIDINLYTPILKEYNNRLESYFKTNPMKRDFTFKYRSPESKIDECNENYMKHNSSIYSAIRLGNTKVFSDTLKQLKSKSTKEMTTWNETYSEILRQIDMADNTLNEYMVMMATAFSKSEIIEDTVSVDSGNIGLKLSELETDYKNTNKDFFEICKKSDINYKTTIDTRNALSELNKKIKNILRYEKLQKLIPFLLTILFAVLSVIIPYTIGESHVFDSTMGALVWLINNLVFAGLMLLGSAVVFLYFRCKKKSLFNKVMDECDKFFKAYLSMAKNYSQKLKTIAKIERISKEIELLRNAKKEFVEYEEKLSYHKNCITKLKRSLAYYKTLMQSFENSSTPMSDTPEINLNKDEKRNKFYYPKRTNQ